MTFIPTQTLAQTAFGELATSQLTPRIQLTFPYGLNTNFVTSSLSGSNSNVYVSGSMLFVETGATQYASASVCTIDVLKYDPGQGAMMRFTAGFSPPKEGSTQWAGLGNNGIDGFYVGYSGSNFGILHRSASIDTFITQSSWSHDKADGTGHLEALDFTKLNVFQIQYQFLGGGNISFYIAGEVVGNVTGNLLGNVDGDVVGNVTGNLLGNIIGNVTGNLSGTFTGTSAYSLYTTTSTTVIIPSTQTYTFVNASAGAVSVTFPSATGLDGQLFVVKKVDSSGNQVMLSGSTTAQLFDGEVTAAINVSMTALSFIASGSNWWLI